MLTHLIVFKQAWVSVWREPSVRLQELTFGFYLMISFLVGGLDQAMHLQVCVPCRPRGLMMASGRLVWRPLCLSISLFQRH